MVVMLLLVSAMVDNKQTKKFKKLNNGDHRSKWSIKEKKTQKILKDFSWI